ncbi:MAG TPA: hypothetical protein VFP59_05945 [Candidatus Angelobacter sp.]|nr:hypothetical protein [Candidatus Angelobacter sp.]
MTRFIKCVPILGIMISLLLAASAQGQQNPERLVLKDGSYQNVTKWEIKGDRVRYYSAERYTWEELPKDLVDWPATEKYNKDRTALRTEAVEDATNAVGPPEPAPPMAAPGLSLPDGGGVFLLDTYQNQPQLVELTQNSGELNKHMGKNILRAAIDPLALSSKQTIDLKGLRAQTQAHTTQPTIYIDVDTGSDNTQNTPAKNEKPASAAPNATGGLGNAPSLGPGASRDAASNTNQATAAKDTANVPDRFRIVRLEKKKDSRVLGNVSVAIYGKVSQKENWVKTISQPAGGDWVKISPAAPLAPGEYAVVELLDKGQVNLFVWDFGVDPAAPANPNAWKAVKSEAGPNGKEAPPGLEKRPK